MIVMFEAPHRIRETLADVREVLGDRVVAMGRELTKAHEELAVGPISALLQRVEVPRGEFTLVVSGLDSAPATAIELPSAERLAAEFWDMTNSGDRSRRELVKALAEKYGVTGRAMYQLLEATKDD